MAPARRPSVLLLVLLSPPRLSQLYGVLGYGTHVFLLFMPAFYHSTIFPLITLYKKRSSQTTFKCSNWLQFSKGPSIYDVHKKSDFLSPLPSVHMSTLARPPLW